MWKTGNDIGCPGAKELGEMLKSNCALTELDLDGDFLKTKLKKKWTSWNKNTFVVTGNDLEEESANALCDGLKMNSSLQKLTLGGI